MTNSSKTRSPRKFTFEFRKEAAMQVISEGRNIKDVADGLGIPDSTLWGWISKFKAGQWHLDSKGNTTNKQKQEPSQEQILIAELRSKLHRVTQERDILKNNPKTLRFLSVIVETQLAC